MAPSSANECSRARSGGAEAAWLGSVAALFSAGCAAVSLERAAPPITDATIKAAAGRGYSAADIGHGREVFIGKCGECHTLQPPAGRSEGEWSEILPRMVRRARLDPGDARCVEAYVLAARGVWTRSVPDAEDTAEKIREAMER